MLTFDKLQQVLHLFSKSPQFLYALFSQLIRRSVLHEQIEKTCKIVGNYVKRSFYERILTYASKPKQD